VIKLKIRIIFLLLVSVIFILIAAQCSSSTPTSAPNTSTNTQPATSTLDGKALLQDRCTACHNLQRAVSRGGNATQWKATVDNMIRQGAQLSADEETALVNYLARTYP
jgi:cytochrome c5